MDLTLRIPYNLSEDQLQVSGRDLEAFSADDDLRDILAGIEAHELSRIMTAAVCLHEHTRHPFLECVQQAVIWERG